MSLTVFLIQDDVFVFDANITHNLGEMAEEAGIYDVVWRPEENGVETASQLIKPLILAVCAMRYDPSRFMKFDSPNGWGKYAHFLPWLERYMEACMTYPNATISVSR